KSKTDAAVRVSVPIEFGECVPRTQAPAVTAARPSCTHGWEVSLPDHYWQCPGAVGLSCRRSPFPFEFLGDPVRRIRKEISKSCKAIETLDKRLRQITNGGF